MKVLINKEVFGIVDEFFMRWEFDFLVVKWMKCLILVGFDDMEYDNGFNELDFWILLDFVENFEESMWMNQL